MVKQLLLEEPVTDSQNTESAFCSVAVQQGDGFEEIGPVMASHRTESAFWVAVLIAAWHIAASVALQSDTVTGIVVERPEWYMAVVNTVVVSVTYEGDTRVVVTALVRIPPLSSFGGLMVVWVMVTRVTVIVAGHCPSTVFATSAPMRK